MLNDGGEKEEVSLNKSAFIRLVCAASSSGLADVSLTQSLESTRDLEEMEDQNKKYTSGSGGGSSSSSISKEDLDEEKVRCLWAQEESLSLEQRRNRYHCSRPSVSLTLSISLYLS